MLSLIFYILLLLYGVIQFMVGNCGIIGFSLSLILLLPLIGVRGLSLYQRIHDQKNWDNYQRKQQALQENRNSQD